MLIVKKINNNVAVGQDGNGREIIVMGKGIGFPSMPYEITDLSLIDRTYYNIDPSHQKLLETVSPELLNFVTRLVDVASDKLDGELNPNLVFILADHINFAINRTKQGMALGLPYSEEMAFHYPEINKLAIWMVKKINEWAGIHLEKGEVTSLVIHLMGALQKPTPLGETTEKRTERIVKKIDSIIEQDLNIKLDKKSFYYFRYKNHIKYFVRRRERNEQYSQNTELLESLKEKNPKQYECVKKIDEFLTSEFDKECSEEEQAYLLLHIVGLSKQEDRNQLGVTSEE
ncbi:MAG: PRD domain-containing protein [Pseudobutyrivibrio sp.]|nr:PRD domain-containing protein [Pseudobutyrivibrio sp.]